MLPKASVLYKMNLFAAHKAYNFSFNSRFTWVYKVFNVEDVIVNKLATDSFWHFYSRSVAFGMLWVLIHFCTSSKDSLDAGNSTSRCFAREAATYMSCLLKPVAPSFRISVIITQVASSPLKAFIVEPHIKSPPRHLGKSSCYRMWQMLKIFSV
jgi:hypothetical protein